MKKILFVSMFLIGGISILASKQNAASQEVRIAIVRDAPDIVFSVRGQYQVIDPLTQEELQSGRQLKPARVKMLEDGLHVGKHAYGSHHIRIIAQKDVSVALKNRRKRYRGAIDIIGDKNKKLLVVNRLDIESYIKGVLYHEVSHRWPLEAMKAQAVAARTYALYQMQANKDRAYDVTSDIYSQVYGGRSAERHRTNLAVERTEGEILKHKNEIFPTYFHSNSGGYTEDAKNVWGDDVSPLKGREDKFAKGAPGYNWKKNFRSKDVQKSLNKNGIKVGVIENIEVVSRHKSGRVSKLKITSRDGNVKTVSGVKFRHAIGPNVVRSTMFDVVMQGYYFDLVGHGWGHGVGMCQWGAHAMSEQRHSYEEILNFYYPQSKLSKL